MKIIFASDNQGKVEEVSAILQMDVKSLKDIGYHQEIEEFGVTFEQNALIKAQEIGKLYPDHFIISDDSGLEVSALDGRPGIYSKRYSGASTMVKENNNLKILDEMKGISNRDARFVSCLCVVNQSLDICNFYKGYVNGTIGFEQIGENGFGYDSIFIYNGKTFASIDDEAKNLVSHRKQALEKLVGSGVLNV